MPKQLTVHNATITTAAVEVKTLTISGKQVTLAVFRQLREEPLIAVDGTLNGVPWGYVNYHPDKCDNDRHWHVVWQRGNELLRSRVNKIPDFDPEEGRRGAPEAFTCEAADRVLTARVREWAHGRIKEAPLPPANSYTNDFGDERFLGKPFGFLVSAVASTAAVSAANKKQEAEQKDAHLMKAQKFASEPIGSCADPNGVRRHRQANVKYAEDAQASAKTAFAEALAKLDAEVDAWGRTYRELGDALTAVARAEAERRQRHRELRTTLAELPQLFIAV